MSIKKGNKNIQVQPTTMKDAKLITEIPVTDNVTWTTMLLINI